MSEQNGRKLALVAVNQLTDQVNDMANAIRSQVDEHQEDPVKLRIALE